ncbi:MAG: hypothetical protein MJ188_10540 [Treponema sp.]|nr:hypothetical protein [Treponema sp.]
MDLILSDDSDFDDSSIDAAIDLKISLQLITHSLPKKTQEYMSLLLSKYLKECGLSSYFNKLSYCLSEILFNAVKANMKRIYFMEKNLDINNLDDYEEGMKTFRQDTLKNKEYYFEKLRSSDLYITYALTIDHNRLVIEVRNNSVMTPIEAQRVKEKIANFHEFTSDEIMGNLVDDTEGAGLGISTIMLTLKSFGLPGDNYQLFTRGKETIARLIVEDSLIPEL